MPDKAALAAETWRNLFDFIIATAAHRNRVLGAHDLTPNDSRALHALSAADGRPMSSLAAAWGCDPSYATSLIDRLVRRGLVARRDHAGDRRVKLVVLTPKGEKVRAAIQQAVYEPPPELLALSLADVRALRNATARLAPPAEPAPVRKRRTAKR